MLTAVAACACSMGEVRRLWAKTPGSSSALFAFERNGRVGFINRHGKIVIPPRISAPIDEVGDFAAGLARVEGRGYISETGRWVVKRKLGSPRHYADGVAWANEDDGSLVLLDTTGETITAWEGQYPRDFSEGLAAFEIRGKPSIRRLRPPDIFYRDFPGLKGFINRQGQVAIEPTFAEVGPFRDGLAVAVLDGYCHVATPDGYGHGSPTSGYPSSCGGYPEDAATLCRTGFIDRTGRFAIEARFEAAQDFQEKLAAVRLGGRWGFIDANGAIVIRPQFQQVKPFREGLAAVKIEGKWGFIDVSGQITIPPTLDAVEPFSDSMALAYSKQGAFYIDTQGRVAIPGPFTEATPFVNGLAAVLVSDNQVAYINYSGKTVFQYWRNRNWP